MTRAALRFVTPGYFATIGIPIRQGRDVSDTDTLDTMPVAVVSESFGREHFPGQDPIGRQFGFAGAVRTIVGVVGDIRFRGLERTNSEPQVYLAAWQQPDGSIASFYAPQDLIVRTSVPPSTLMPAVRAHHQEGRSAIADHQHADARRSRVARDRAARRAAARARWLRDRLRSCWRRSASTACSRFRSARASREIGVRIALGAKASDIMWMVMGRSTTLALIGVTLGAAARLRRRPLACRRCSSASSPANATVFAAAIGVSLLMTLAGSILPAWRADSRRSDDRDAD